MKKTIFHLYCAAVCLLSVAAVVVLAGTVVNLLIDRINYESSLQPWELQRFANNDNFFAWATSERNGLDARLRPESSRPDESTLTAIRESSAAQYHAYRKSVLNRSIREQLIYAALALGAFIFHYRVLRRHVPQPLGDA